MVICYLLNMLAGSLPKSKPKSEDDKMPVLGSESGQEGHETPEGQTECQEKLSVGDISQVSQPNACRWKEDFN